MLNPSILSHSAPAAATNVTVLTSDGGVVEVEALPDRRQRISIQPRPGFSADELSWETSYPLPLIQAIHSVKGLWVCDEIMREEDPLYVEHHLRHAVLGYLNLAEFAGRRILDFGCGSGASTMVLSRLLPSCDIVGIELEEGLLEIARLRAEHFGRHRVRFIRSPSSDAFPDDLGQFDFVMLSAVFEHLLPQERRSLLPRIWSHLKPEGILFLNQTPHRYSPIEAHTTRLPAINYLPDGLALRAARRFSKCVRPDEDWKTLLRRGIRGGTVREILGVLAACGSATLLKPKKSVGDQIDLWYGTLSRRRAWLKKSIWASLKLLKTITRAEFTPDLSLAIRKES